MRLTIILSLLLITSFKSVGQITIYYDQNCNITMKELATHYRKAKLDTISYKFLGEVVELWDNDSIGTKLNYDSSGNKNGVVQIKNRNGKLILNGQYSFNEKSGIWTIHNPKEFSVDFSKKYKGQKTIDSIETCILNKDAFNVSIFIRKRDYPQIFPGILKYRLKAHQLNKQNLSGIYNFVEQQPSFPNGMQALGQFIGAFIKTPEEALKNNIKGQVIVEFVITEVGSTTDFKIVKSLGYGCDEEAIRVLKLLPDWKPGKQGGRAVRTKFKIPIRFE